MLNKEFNRWSDTNKKTNGKIELGFGIIGVTLGICAVLNMLALGDWIVAVISSAALIAAGTVFTELADKLKKDRVSKDKADAN